MTKQWQTAKTRRANLNRAQGTTDHSEMSLRDKRWPQPLAIAKYSQRLDPKGNIFEISCQYIKG